MSHCEARTAWVCTIFGGRPRCPWVLFGRGCPATHLRFYVTSSCGLSRSLALPLSCRPQPPLAVAVSDACFGLPETNQRTAVELCSQFYEQGLLACLIPNFREGQSVCQLFCVCKPYVSLPAGQSVFSLRAWRMHFTITIHVTAVYLHVVRFKCPCTRITRITCRHMPVAPRLQRL